MDSGIRKAQDTRRLAIYRQLGPTNMTDRSEDLDFANTLGREL
jgi:hypothetical protein